MRGERQSERAAQLRQRLHRFLAFYHAAAQQRQWHIQLLNSRCSVECWCLCMALTIAGGKREPQNPPKPQLFLRMPAYDDV